MKSLRLTLLLAPFLFFSSCKNDVNCGPLITDPSANLEQFIGTWFEIASIPQLFNLTCECTTASYSLREDGKVGVLNRCRRGGAFPGVYDKINGTATQSSPDDFSKLEVSFGFPGDFGAPYWITEFAEDGSYLVVSDPMRSTFFLLSRTKSIEESLYQEILARAAEQCIPIGQIKRTKQRNDCEYQL